MTDPIRWSEAGDSASSVEQALVQAGQELAMPSDEKHAVWQGVFNALPAGAAVSMSGQASAGALTKTATATGPASLWVLKGAKALYLLAALVGLGTGGYHWLKSTRTIPAPVPTQATVLPSALPSPPVVPVAANAAPRVEPAPSAPAVAQVAAPSHMSQLKEESQAVMAARQALRSNDAGRALHLLEQAQVRFKRGALTEEREALTIEALAKTGQSAQASARAQAFLAQYPRSPHAADVQRFIAK